MITAYFDDSGTLGDKSNVVLVAGLFGTDLRRFNDTRAQSTTLSRNGYSRPPPSEACRFGIPQRRCCFKQLI